MECIIYKSKNNTHALLLLVAVVLFVGMSCNANAAAAGRKMKLEDTYVNNGDDAAPPAVPPFVAAPEPEPEPATTTVTFFMHDVVGGPNPTAKPLSISGGSSSLLNPSGLIPPITTTPAGGLLNLPFQNGGPFPLTFPSGAIPQNSLLNGQFPATSINPNGFVSSSNPSFVNGLGPIIPAATSAGLLNTFQNGPVLPLTFPNGFVPSASNNPLLNGIGINNNINGQNVFPLTSQQGIPFINSPNLLNPLQPNSPLPGAGASGAGQGLGLGTSSNYGVIVIEDPLTEGPDESSALVGKGEGYYMPSPQDPKTLLMTFIAKFEEGSEYEGGSIEFSGEDNTALSQREIAVVGGSGKFQDAKGHAVIETISNSPEATVLKFTVNLTY